MHTPALDDPCTCHLRGLDRRGATSWAHGPDCPARNESKAPEAPAGENVAPKRGGILKRARRVISHHGSDCPDGPHSFRHHRCMILTRIDHEGGRSEAWVSGDYQETMPMRSKIEPAWFQDDSEVPREEWPASERVQRKRHTFDSTKTTWYGGGFWERVEIGPR